MCHLALTTVCLLAGSLAAATSPGLQTGTLTWQGLDRSYLVYVPQAAVDDPHRTRRLLIVLHGLGNTAAGFRDETRQGFEALAEADDVIVVYPDGHNSA